MRGNLWIAIVASLMLVSGPTFADDKADCLKGIAKLKAVKIPTAQQKKRLSDAQQEQIEADWNECKDVLAK